MSLLDVLIFLEQEGYNDNNIYILDCYEIILDTNSILNLPFNFTVEKIEKIGELITIYLTQSIDEL